MSIAKNLLPGPANGRANSLRFLLVLILALVVLCAAIKSARLDVDLSSWVQRTARVDAELDYVEEALGAGAGSTSQLLIQTPRRGARGSPSGDLLNVDAFMVHLEAMAIATQTTIDLYEVTWSLKDICFTPSLPDYENFHVTNLLENLPCAIKTPLDCFWEGAKLLGPEQPIELGFGLKLKWTNLNPLRIVETIQRAHPHASYPFEQLAGWMRRVGITSGYQYKPCLDPTDPNCPATAPNKRTGQQPDLGAQLAGGCRGFAALEMHWTEDEILGGVERNKSTGQPVSVQALQSTIQLMGEQDMYNFWRKTSKVQDINNWSSDKARMVITTWQRRFQEELGQFARNSSLSRAYNLHAITSQSMLEPIDMQSLLDLRSVYLALGLITLFACIVIPSLKPELHCPGLKPHQAEGRIAIARLKLIPLAIFSSLLVALTFVSSLGLSSFINLPFNMATIQILPPLALCFGFNQFHIVISHFVNKLRSPQLVWDSLAYDCLKELVPILTIQSSCYVKALLVSTIIPVQATRAFAFQAIVYILLVTLIAIILVPSMLITYLAYLLPASFFADQMLLRRSSNGGGKYSSKISLKTETGKLTLTSKGKSGKIACSARTGSKNTTRCDDETNLEEQIFSRIQDDLNNIGADQTKHQPIDTLSFSARLGPGGGLQTSLSFSTPPPNSQRMKSRGLNRSGRTEKTTTNRPLNDYVRSPEQIIDCNSLPDVVIGGSVKSRGAINGSDSLPDKLDANESSDDDEPTKPSLDDLEDGESDIESDDSISSASSNRRSAFSLCAYLLTSNRVCQMLMVLAKVGLFAAILCNLKDVKFSLQLSDIVTKGTAEYESLQIQERYFPVYNVYAVTKGNFDYPANQRLLLDYYESIRQAGGIIDQRDDYSRPKFWLISFREWLLDLQDKFDADRNNSRISNEGWTPEASANAKLAYKLLAQTGKLDNPIDKGQVETTRLVDAKGIINPKAFYYYLTAWVFSDAFTYSASQANFRPEPKVWNDRSDDLKIERARPLVFAQIPFLMKLADDKESLDHITQVRRISQRFESLSLPNFPSGIPFIFWDQFMDLDFMFLVAAIIGVVSMFVMVSLVESDLRLSAIATIPVIVTLIELYCVIGYLSIPFNNIVAVLLISSMGIATSQAIQITSLYRTEEGSCQERAYAALRRATKTVLISSVPYLIAALVFSLSKTDFTIRFSAILYSLIIISTFSSLIFMPVLLSLFGTDNISPLTQESPAEVDLKLTRKPERKRNVIKRYVHKKRSRGYPRVKSAISLSTISEEPQSEAQIHDLKFDLSIRCY